MFLIIGISFYFISSVFSQISLMDHCLYANPCQNAGTCINNSTNELRLSCLCPTRFNGVFCQNSIECNPCLAESCTNLGAGGFCLCESEYKGIFVKCPVSRGVCDLTPGLCLNGGVCKNSVESIYGFECICPSHHTGLRCTTEVLGFDPCEYINCLNGGTCTQHASGFICDCSDNFDGVMCENRVFVVENVINDNVVPTAENLVAENNNIKEEYFGQKFDSKIIEGIVGKWISERIVKSFQNFLLEIKRK